MQYYYNRINMIAASVKRLGLPVIIVDLDGTLADGTKRLHLLPTENQHLTETWREFNLAASNDAPIESTIQLLNILTNTDDVITIVLTGRADHVWDETCNWLNCHHVEYDYLVMRSEYDNRKDTVIKEEFLRTIGLDNIMCAFDDSPNVIAHFRSLGITTYAVVDYGDAAHREDLKSHGVEKLCTSTDI